MKKNRTSSILIPALLSLILIVTVGFVGTSVYAEEGTAITNAEELKAMENNPSGNYYLANDIEIPENMTIFTASINPFTGTLDGRGHALKNHSITSSIYTALFAEASGATFKNIKVTGFSANITDRMKSTWSLAGLVRKATNCTFTNISISGSVTVNTPKLSQYAAQQIGGIVANATSCTFSKCTNKTTITVTDSVAGGCAAGIAASGFYNKFTNCTNAAPIKVTAGGENGIWSIGGVTAGGEATLTSCKNSGAITYKVANAPNYYFEGLSVAGVATDAKSLTGCSNSGKVTVDATALKGKSTTDDICIAGLAGSAYGVKKCSNTGAVSYNGVGGGKSNVYLACAGGLVGHKGNYTASPVALTESYNTGKVIVKLSEGTMRVGGVAGNIFGAASNCYNTGAVSLNKGYCAGGVFGYLDAGKKTVSGLYNKGKVTGGGDSKNKAAAIAGYYEVPYSKNTVKNTYYTSGKGIVNASYVKNQQAKPVKVSAITAKKCPGLSSKYWTYSGKYKRLVLKNNKEV